MPNTFLPIFSGGTGRSGTTLVGKILRKHSTVHAGNPYEIKFLTGKGGLIDLVSGHLASDQSPSSRLHYISGFIWSFPEKRLSPRRINELREKMTGQWWSRDGKLGGTVGLVQGFELATLERELDTLQKGFASHPVCSSRKFFYDFISSHKFFENSRVVVDTTPTNIERSQQVHALLHNAKFIHITRDGRDTISSVLKEPWGPKNPDKALDWWKRKHINAHHATSQLPESALHRMRLEDLVDHDREASYQKLLTFVGLEDEAEIRNFFEAEVVPTNAHVERWREDSRLDDNFNKKFQDIVAELADMGIKL